ncbi:WAT1-related protein At3g30340-like [Phragmites australis]|uniref:WAT1-related protein At3g30340-like n=1 Tax=Phragmites australis TaxID=29695 RepID=UPI002D79B1DF|nr:WAT1-related protein At3g30340-like [Phragmites australis]
MGSLLGDGLPVAVMLCLNIVAAIMVSLVKVAMDGGMNPLVLVTLQQLTASAFLAPIAYFKERKSRPKLTLEIFGYIFVSAALGSALRQYMIFVGLQYTTATFVTAFSNIAPVLTFLLAVATRSEALNLKSKMGMAKLVGTLVSLGGAMVLTFYKGVALTHAAPPQHLHSRQHGGAADSMSRGKWTLGTVAILGNCVCLSCWFLFHGRLARKYPHVYSCNALMSALSFLQVAVVGLCTQRRISPWIVKSKFQILTVLYAGILGCGVSFVLLTWCIEKRGPVFVAAFIPIVQIIVSVIDFCILHEQLYLGSVLGSVLVIGGLYLLLWGKRQEALNCPPKAAQNDDKEQQQQQEEQQVHN